MSYFDPKDGSENFFKDFADWFKIKENDSNSVASFFDKIGSGYSLHMEQKVLSIHQKLVNLLLEQIEIDQYLDKNCTILDVCCGTGIIGKCLRKAGFTGNMEGVDGSQGMLNEAAKLQNVYNKLYTEIIKLNGPTLLPKESYDVIIVGHGFFPNYLSADHLDKFFGLLRVAGLLVFDLRYDVVEGPDVIMSYIATIDNKLKQLVKEGKCELVAYKDITNDAPRLKYVETNQYHNCVPLNENFIHERHMCYRKL